MANKTATPAMTRATALEIMLACTRQNGESKFVLKDQKVQRMESSYAPLIPDKVDTLWRKLSRSSGAHDSRGLVRYPFFSQCKMIYERLRDDPSLQIIEDGARVYYDTRLLPTAAIALNAVTRTAACASPNDLFLQLVSGKKLRGPLPLEELHKFGLMSRLERMACKGRVIAVWGHLFAHGGFPHDSRNPFVMHKSPSVVLFLHAVQPNLEHPLLEGGTMTVFAPCTLSEADVRAVAKCDAIPLNPHRTAWFLSGRYKSTMARTVGLVLEAAKAEAKRLDTRFWLKLPPLGASVWTYLPFGSVIPHGTCVNLFREAVEQALLSVDSKGAPVSMFLVAVELPDFTSTEAYTPSLEFQAKLSVPVVAGRCRARDLLKIAPKEDAKEIGSKTDAFDYCVVVSGNGVAVPGNGRHYFSLDSMVGNNTSLRRDGCWIYNKQLVNVANYVPIDSIKSEEP